MNYCRKLRDVSTIIERNLHLLLIPHFDPFLRRLRIRFDRARGGKRKIPIRPHRSRAFISRTTSGSLAPALKRGANEEAIWLAASCLARLSDINLRNWKRRGSQLAENSSMDVTIPQTRLEERKGGGVTEARVQREFIPRRVRIAARRVVAASTYFTFSKPIRRMSRDS